ncbi:MAG: GAF domain-containing protein, partial [Candidatus Gastranaerophilales bacterium]|nr:GAF domain-containing protein [Candidatus Gastranaerophilales bacterium]
MLFLLLILFVPEPSSFAGNILFRLAEAILLITLVTLIIGCRFESFRKLLWEAERERILRQITDKIIETSDIVEIENIIVTEIGRLFNANRCLIRDYIPEYNTFSEPVAEYLSDESVKSLKNFCIIKETNKLLTEYLVQKKLIVSDDIERHLAVNGWQNSALANFIREFSIKAGILQVMMTYKDEILGLLAIHYTKNRFIITQNDIEFIKNIMQEASSV